MVESSNNKIVKRLHQLADRIELSGILPGSLARVSYLLDELEPLADGPPKKGHEKPSAAEKGLTPGAAVLPGTIRIWSDGSCAPNPGPGGWAAIVERDGARAEFSGGSPASTNNIMEMTGAIEGLRHTPPGSAVEVTTDSRYLVDGMSKWLAGWKRKGWQTSSREPVKNREQWETLDRLASDRRVRWVWVEGHAGHPENERCDQLANAARERVEP